MSQHPLTQPSTNPSGPPAGSAHIHKLPVELVSEIFRVVRDGTKSQEQHQHYMSWALPLVSVCKSWHAIVMRNPRLWTSMQIRSNTTTDSFLAWLRRSARANIQVEWRDLITTPTHVQILRELTHIGDVQRLTKLTLQWPVSMRGPVCGFVEQHLGKASGLVSLYLEEDPDTEAEQSDEMTEDRLWEVVQSDTDDVVTIQDGPSVPGLLQLPHLPKLRNLTTSLIAVNFAEEAHELRSLKMVPIVFGPEASWAPSKSWWIFNVLRRCPGLRKLTLECGGTVDPDDIANTPDKISLPDLRAMNVTTTSGLAHYARNFLSNICLGPATNIEIHTSPDDDIPLFSNMLPDWDTIQRTPFRASTTTLSFVANSCEFDLKIRDVAESDEQRLHWLISNDMEGHVDYLLDASDIAAGPVKVVPTIFIVKALQEIPQLVPPSNIVELVIDFLKIDITPDVVKNYWVPFWTAFVNLRQLTIGEEDAALVYLRHLPKYATSMAKLRQLEIRARAGISKVVRKSWFMNHKLNDAACQTELTITIYVRPIDAGECILPRSTTYGNLQLVVDRRK